MLNGSRRTGKDHGVRETREMNARMWKKTTGIIACVVVGLAATSLQAAMVDLDLRTDDAGNWEVYLTTDDAVGDGLASITIDVWGTGGADVLTATNNLPQGPFALEFFSAWGFNQFPSNGTRDAAGHAFRDIRAAQNTIGGAGIVTNIGITAGSVDDSVVGLVEWDAPVLVASGTYSGQGTSGAKLHVGLNAVSPGAGLIPNGWAGGAMATFTATPQNVDTDEVDVGGGGVDTDPPVIDFTGRAPGEYDGKPAWREEDWPLEPSPWNNPAREITLSAGVTDASPLTVELWAAHPTTPTAMQLIKGMTSGSDFSAPVSIAELSALGALPENGYVDEALLWYPFEVRAEDSAGNSAMADGFLFVPEPGTLALLAMGGLAALIRRKRS